MSNKKVPVQTVEFDWKHDEYRKQAREREKFKGKSRRFRRRRAGL